MTHFFTPTSTRQVRYSGYLTWFILSSSFILHHCDRDMTISVALWKWKGGFLEEKKTVDLWLHGQIFWKRVKMYQTYPELIFFSNQPVVPIPWWQWLRVANCQIFYMDQNLQSRFYTDISVISLTFCNSAMTTHGIEVISIFLGIKIRLATFSIFLTAQCSSCI